MFSNDCRCPGCGTCGGAEEAERLRRALKNVLALSHRIRKTDPENAEHLRRFCAEVGVVPEITR